MPIIETSGLSKKFEEKTVADGASLKIRKGEFLKLLGSNSARKLVKRVEE